MEKEGFIYIWYDRKRTMFYIGCHWGTIDDGYICSSNRMRDAYRRRPHDFKRRIIQKGIERGNLLSEEYKWLSLIPDDQLGKRYYNHSKHHFGHWSSNPQQVLSMREKNLGKNNPRYGKKHTDEWKQKLSEMNSGEGNPFYGKTHSEKTRQKWSEKRVGVKYKKGRRSAMFGKTHSEETKRKMRDAMSGSNNPFFGRKHSEETKRKISEAKKKVKT